VKDRVVQAAVKNIMEPIFEADFYPVSYGFRPGKSVHGAIAHLKVLMRSRGGQRWKRAERLPFQWAIEGDIKGCFDNIGHHGFMERVRRRVGDAKLERLVSAFLKAGILSEEQFLRSDSGTPQGGTVSPILANIYMDRLDRFVEQTLIPEYTKGIRRAKNPIYDQMSGRAYYCRRTKRVEEAKRLEHARRTGVRTGVAMPLRVRAGKQLLHGGISGHQDGIIEERNLDRLARAGALSRDKGAENCVAGHHRRADVHHRR